MVGIRNASIHHHFPSKSDLVRTLVVRYREEAEAGIAELERHVSDPVEQLGAYTALLGSLHRQCKRTLLRFALCSQARFRFFPKTL